jgi:hypothetical protein
MEHKLTEWIPGAVNLLLGHQGLLLRNGKVVNVKLIPTTDSPAKVRSERNPELH